MPTRARGLGCLLVLLTLALADHAAAAREPPAPWPTMNGNPANTRWAPSNVTPTSALGIQTAWTYEANGSVTGTPVHDGRVAYFGDWAGVVHAVELQTGRALWTSTRGAGITASLALDGTRVFAGDMTGNLTARSAATGAELWRARLDAAPAAHLYGSPVPHAGRVFVGVASRQTSIEYEGVQTFRGSVVALDAATGAIVWRTMMQPEDALGVSVWTTPAIDADRRLLFVGTGNAYGPPPGQYANSIVALHLENGSIAWSFQATSGDVFDGRGSRGPDADFGASPLLFEAGGRKLVGDGDKNGTFYTLDRATGELVWSTHVEHKTPETPPDDNEGFIGTAAHSNGLIVAPTTDRSMLHALDAATGQVRWTRELNTKPLFYGERMFGATTIADGVVIQGNAFGQLFILDERDGEILVEIDVGSDVQGGVSLAGDLILVPGAGNELWDKRGRVTAYRATLTPSPPTPTPRPSPTTGPEDPSPGPPPDANPTPAPNALPAPTFAAAATAALLAAVLARRGMRR